MGHNLNETNSQVSMMYVGEVPWHGLGTKLDKPATATEAIQTAGLDFMVEKVPLKTDPLGLIVPRNFATIRTDTNEILGVVGARYSPIQNRHAFTVFDSLVGEEAAIYHTAGVLGKGEKIWLLAKLPDYIRVNGNDLVEKFLLLLNSHDGSGPVRAKLTPIRVVCENTLAMALGGSEQEVHIRHTLNAQAKLETAHEVLGLSNHLYAQLSEIFNNMRRKSLDFKATKEYISTVFPIPAEMNTRSVVAGIHAKVLELTETGQGAEMAKGTLWGAYNAVTEYVDHYRIPKATPSARLKSIWLGSGNGIKKHAFTVGKGMLN